jgi:hypothetical protein
MLHSRQPRGVAAAVSSSAGIAVALAMLLGMWAANGNAQTPVGERSDHVSRMVCYRMVQSSGRVIAWARWEQDLPIEQARSRSQRDDASRSQAELVENWVSDAYRWEVTDAQVREWASELGSMENIPQADRLKTHEIIAIWLRRIARRCGE